MKTQLILFHRPANNAIVPDGTGTPTEAYTYRLAQNPNEIISESFVGIVRPANKTGASGLALDLYEGISIPITFSISDIREPEKKEHRGLKQLLYLVQRTTTESFLMFMR